ncbi:hypothetical protein [Paenibacillus sp. 481]|uniref:hypothetical protein n=1 Tax=Paenibacillus sp. 481 TaxID=2835869 RepID=UPI001E4A4D66|nr:hypothetical protein [Paenibacillus sp. 481]UHA72016.1 hypothetical protein KIK04_14990 [Paenibacillus sp. 481]
MKMLSKAILSTVLAFGLLSGSVGAESLNQQSVETQATIINPITKLRVGWSKWFGMQGSRVVLVSGHGVVSLDQYGKATALKPGNATVYNYAADGNLYVNYIVVTYF